MAVLNGERMHDTMERLLPGARSAALLWQGAAVLGGAALGTGQVYGGAAPFGLALVIGCPPSYCLAAALGTLAAGLAFQPMLLGVKLAVAAVAAASVRRLIDGRPGAGALAGCLTLTAAQALQIVLAGGLFNPGQTVTVGCTALLAAVFGWAFAHFPAREPRGVCLWLAVATACLQRCAVGPLAPGLALAAGAGLCAAIGGTLEQTAVLSIALAVLLVLLLLAKHFFRKRFPKAMKRRPLIEVDEIVGLDRQKTALPGSFRVQRITKVFGPEKGTLKFSGSAMVPALQVTAVGGGKMMITNASAYAGRTDVKFDNNVIEAGTKKYVISCRTTIEHVEGEGEMRTVYTCTPAAEYKSANVY